MTPGIFHSSGIFVHGMNGRYQSPGLPPRARTRAAQSGIDIPQRGVERDHGPSAGTSSPLYSCSCQPSSATMNGRVASPSTNDAIAFALERNASAVPCP